MAPASGCGEGLATAAAECATNASAAAAAAAAAVASSLGPPPPPQKLFEYLNGHLIGHYIMKKALSVAVYNHYSDVSMKRKLMQRVPSNNSLESLEESSSSSSSSAPAMAKDSSLTVAAAATSASLPSSKPPIRPSTFTSASERKISHDSGFGGGANDSTPPARTYLTPIVARVIIEASSHRVHLRQSNTLTFDSTGSSRPLEAIASNLARFLDVPFLKCDCRTLVPRTKRRSASTRSHIKWCKPQQQQQQQQQQQYLNHPALRRGSLGNWVQLLEGVSGDCLDEIMAKLFKQSDYELDRAERAIVFLDAMDNVGSAVADIDDDQKEVEGEIVEEILEMIKGTEFKLTRPKKPNLPLEAVGAPPDVLEAPEAAAATRPEDSRDAPQSDPERVTLNTSHMFFICFGVNDNLAMKQTGEKKDYSDNSTSCSSGNNNYQETSAKAIKAKHSNEAAFSVKGRSFDSVGYSFESYEDVDEDEDDEEDDSLSGLKENPLAKELITHNPLPHCQNLWGLKDVELKIQPEALEIIANQASHQHAGVDGVRTILEKLLFTAKFEIPDEKVVAVEITEDFVLGKALPVYHHHHHHHHHHHSSKLQQQQQQQLRPINEEEEDAVLKTVPLTEFEQAILEQLEL